MTGPSLQTEKPQQEPSRSDPSLSADARPGTTQGGRTVEIGTPPPWDARSNLRTDSDHLSGSERKKLSDFGALKFNPLHRDVSPYLRAAARELEDCVGRVCGSHPSYAAAEKIDSAVRALIRCVEGGIVSETGRIDLMHLLAEEHWTWKMIRVPQPGPAGLTRQPLFDLVAGKAFQDMNLDYAANGAPNGALAHALDTLRRNDWPKCLVEDLVRFVTLKTPTWRTQAIDTLVDGLF